MPPFWKMSWWQNTKYPIQRGRVREAAVRKRHLTWDTKGSMEITLLEVGDGMTFQAMINASTCQGPASLSNNKITVAKAQGSRHPELWNSRKKRSLESYWKVGLYCKIQNHSWQSKRFWRSLHSLQAGERAGQNAALGGHCSCAGWRRWRFERMREIKR